MAKDKSPEEIAAIEKAKAEKAKTKKVEPLMQETAEKLMRANNVNKIYCVAGVWFTKPNDANNYSKQCSQKVETFNK